MDGRGSAERVRYPLPGHQAESEAGLIMSLGDHSRGRLRYTEVAYGIVKVRERQRGGSAPGLLAGVA